MQTTRECANLRPAWLEINLDNLHANFDAVRQKIGTNVKILAVVKANAYGAGIREISRELSGKAHYFGVAFLQEALALREIGIKKPILIFGAGQPADAPFIAKHKLEQTVTSWEMAEALSAAGIAAGHPINVHLKVDTGMGRLGIRPEETLDFVDKLQHLPGIKLVGVFSHFPTNLNNFPDHTRRQLQVFLELLAALQQRGCHIPLRHIANSSAVFQQPDAHLDMVRPGGCLYGLGTAQQGLPVISMKARVTLVRELPAGAGISYGLTYRTTEKTRIAILPLGYTDGLPRALSNRGQVLIGGRRYPIVGTICMDQTIVNVGNAPVQAGDEAVLLGRQNTEEINVNDMVKLIDGTSSNEIASRLSLRLPRVYLRGGQPIYINHGYLPAAN